METENPQGPQPPPFPEGAKRPQPPPPAGGPTPPWNAGYPAGYQTDDRYRDRWDRRSDRWAAKAQRRQERWDRRAERWGAGRGGGPGGGLFIGLFITFMGVVFLLRNLNIFYFDDIGKYWPVLLIAFGASRLTSVRNAHQAAPGVILMSLGTLFLLRNLHVININPWQFFWPVILIVIGVSMLLRNLDGGGPGTGGAGPGSIGRPGSPSASGPSTGSGPAFFGQANRGFEDVGGADIKQLRVEVVFSGARRKIISQEFEGGKAVAVFGGVEVDLREANIKGEAMLHCDAVFGGIDVWVPQNWTIDIRGAGVFGAFQDQTLHRSPPVQSEIGQLPLPARLVVRGSAVFGGVTIRN